MSQGMVDPHISLRGNAAKVRIDAVWPRSEPCEMLSSGRNRGPAPNATYFERQGLAAGEDLPVFPAETRG